MKIEKINSILRSQAIELGLCQQWQDDWQSDKSVKELCEMFLKGIDFCLNWPTAKEMRKFFDKDEIAQCGVFLDRTEPIEISKSGVYAVTGKSRCTITVKDFAVATIHILGHESVCTIVSKGMAKVFVRVYGYSHVFQMQTELSTIKVRKSRQN
ncbi:MAG: hypothetical protein LIP09_14095 [Bacteroidales bacterium]|nr:hypothetical protein [Bacteroidales bacterium]MCC8119860.1 hypothetical protein [Bacteroidales bacterium]